MALPVGQSLNSRGGVQFPTGGERLYVKPASARRQSRGQQIRCNSGADGESPDERECLSLPAALFWAVKARHVYPFLIEICLT